jgi:hypothetical protein
MSATRFPRAAAPLHAEPPARRLLAAYLLSLLLHGVLLLSVTGGWRSTPPRDVQPVYYVDLVHKPVLNPQAGRPEPRLNQPPAPPAPVTSLPEKAVPPGKASPATRAPVKSSDRQVAAAVQKLRDERDRQAAIDRLRQSQAVPADLPVGLPDAKGNEAGVTSLVYVQAFIQQQWALNPYQLQDAVKMAQLNVWAVLTYDKGGRLVSYRIEKESGDHQFDESVKRAILKSKQLPVTLPVKLEDLRVIFNLRELNALAEARR